MSIPADAPAWAHRLEQDLRADIARAKTPPTRLKGAVTAGTRAGETIFVPDLTGGAENCFWDPVSTTPGQWRRCSDRTVIS
jgi:hypothetical protein